MTTMIFLQLFMLLQIYLLHTPVIISENEFWCFIVLHKCMMSKGKADLFIPVNLLNLLLKSSSLVCGQLIWILIFLQVSIITFDLPAPLGWEACSLHKGLQKDSILLPTLYHTHICKCFVSCSWFDLMPLTLWLQKGAQCEADCFCCQKIQISSKGWILHWHDSLNIIIDTYPIYLYCSL